MTDDELPGEPADEPSGEQPHDDTGLDLARSIARGLAGKTPAKRRTSRDRPGAPNGSRRRRGEAQVSGAHPDERDPQTLDASLGRTVADQGWGTDLRVHGVFSRWAAIVGRDVGEHVTPESFSEGKLVVRTDSTAWATQMKLLAPDVVRRLNEVLGEGTIEVIDIQGPRPPSWNRGRLRVKGRGPRDTYG